MTHVEIVNKLIGDIQPVGETHVDVKRFENLKEMCHLVNCLVIEIDKVAHENKGRLENSMKEAGRYASNFLIRELGIAND